MCVEEFARDFNVLWSGRRISSVYAAWDRRLTSSRLLAARWVSPALTLNRGDRPPLLIAYWVAPRNERYL